MKILMIVSNDYNHDPRVRAAAEALKSVGHYVVVLCVDFKGNLREAEVVNGVLIVKVRSRLFRLVGRKFFKIIIFRWLAYKKAKNSCTNTKNELRPYDVIYCHDLDTLPIGIKLKRHQSLVYDAHEIYGYIMRRHLPEFMCKYYLRKEERLLKKVDLVITVNEYLRDYFKKVTDKPIEVVMNTKPLQKYRYPTNKIFTLVYIGSLIKERFVEELVDVVRWMEDVKLIIGGIGALSDKLRETCQATKNVDFMGVVPYEDVLNVTLSADAVVHLVDPSNLNNKMGYGNKQFEAMACGKPIICIRWTASGWLTQREHIGTNCHFNKESLRRAIIRLKDDHPRDFYGYRAWCLAKNEYNREIEDKKLVGIVERLLYVGAK